MPRIRFDAAVNLGHVLQIIALTGAVITAYVGLQRDLEMSRGEYRVGMAGLESRINVAEHGITERRVEEREFVAEVRSSLSDIQRLLSEIQIRAAAASNRSNAKWIGK